MNEHTETVTLSALLAAASISTLARVCGVTPRTVGNWRAGGKVPFVAVYLIAQYTQIPIERVRPDLEGDQR